MTHRRILIWVRLMTTLVGSVAIVAISLFGSGSPMGSDIAHGQTIPTVTPESEHDLTPSPTRGNDEDGEVEVDPGRGGEGESSGRHCRVVITPGDVSEPGTLVLTDVAVSELPNRDDGYTYLRACDLRFRSPNGDILSPYMFANPVNVCIPYTDEDLVRAQNQIARLTILAYDEVTSQWYELSVVLDEAARQICGQLPQTGIVALAVKGGDISSLPDTSGNMPEGTPVAVATAVAAAAPAAAALPTLTAVVAAAADPVAPAAVGTSAAVGGSALAAPPSATAQPSPSTGGVPIFLILGLLLVFSVVATVVVLSRGFLTRANEGEE